MDSHIIDARFLKAVEVVTQMPQFLILPVVVEGQDRYTVADVEGKAQSTIVDDDHVFQIAIFNYSQIFDEAILRLNAVLSVKSTRKYLVFGVYMVQDSVSVQLITCCEGHNLVRILQIEQAFAQARSDVDIYID